MREDHKKQFPFNSYIPRILMRARHTIQRFDVLRFPGNIEDDSADDDEGRNKRRRVCNESVDL